MYSFFNSVLEFVNQSGVDIYDFENVEQFGFTNDGRMIILDSGLTREVYNHYYYI